MDEKFHLLSTLIVLLKVIYSRAETHVDVPRDRVGILTFLILEKGIVFAPVNNVFPAVILR